MKFVEFSGSSSKTRYLTALFLETFENILTIMASGVQCLNDKVKIGVWRHCLHVVGNGGSRLETIIKKSNHFVKNLNLGYLEGEANIFFQGQSKLESSGRKQSDSGYSSQLSSAFEGESG